MQLFDQLVCAYCVVRKRRSASPVRPGHYISEASMCFSPFDCVDSDE